jgi:uncharacterized protein (DUF302 family)
MLLIKKTSKSVDQAGQALEAAAAHQSFGVLAIHDLQATMAKKGVDFPNACRIYEVCNPQQAKKVLERNMEISTALPCRISIYQSKDGGTEIATILPTVMIDLYGSDELKSVARDVEEKIAAMIEEAAN